MKPTLKQHAKDFWWNEDFEKVFPPHVAGTITQPNMLVAHWDLGRDYGAYAYEMARRGDKKLKLRPYPKLTADESQFLFRIFGMNKDRRAYEVYFLNLHPSKPLAGCAGYSQPSIWKLDVPIGTLKMEFEKFIEWQRTVQNIKPGKKSHTVSTPPPWKQIELLDGQPDYLDAVRALNRARKASQKYLQIFKANLKKETRNHPNLRVCLWPELDKLLCK